MYMTHVKTILHKAMRTTFDGDYPVSDFRNINVTTEYPVQKADYPAVWVDFDPIGPLRPVGVGYFEDTLVEGSIVRTTRWSFAGNAIYTVAAMSSFERDRLFDQVVSVVAFGQVDAPRSEFRTTIETDPLVAISVNFEQVDQRGFSAAPGTPWQTDDMMYEGSLSIQLQGEFILAPSSTTLVPISAVNIISWVNELETDPTTPDGWIG